MKKFFIKNEANICLIAITMLLIAGFVAMFLKSEAKFQNCLSQNDLSIECKL
jgi:hypothetical protein